MAHESMYVPRTGVAGSPKSRLKVDTGSTGFYRGFEFRAYVPINIPAAGTLNIRVATPVNLILKTSRMTLVQGSRLATATRGSAFGGTWSTNPSIAQNIMTEVAKYPDEVFGTQYATAVVISTSQSASGAPAGTITGGVESDRIYVHTGTTQGNRSSSTVAGEGEVRGLGPGTYGITIAAIPGITNTDACVGVYELIWEERPIAL